MRGAEKIYKYCLEKAREDNFYVSVAGVPKVRFTMFSSSATP